MNDFWQRNDPVVIICFYRIFLSLCFFRSHRQEEKRNK